MPSSSTPPATHASRTCRPAACGPLAPGTYRVRYEPETGTPLERDVSIAAERITAIDLRIAE